jgi:glycosyltransferase involved in cell wall biosynthesis
MIDYAGTHGGAERIAVDLAARLPQDRFEPWVCATRSMDPWSTTTLDAAGVPHVTLGRRSKWDLHRFGRLVTMLRAQRFQILHTHKFGSNAWGAMIGTACRVPVIVAHEHTWSYEGKPLRVWVDGHVIGGLADRVVAVSNADARRMVSIEHIDPSKIVVIPNGYIPHPGSYTDVRAELGIDDRAPVIATAAIMRPQKRQDLLLDAFAQVREAVPDAQLLLAGDGDCRDELTDQAATLGISGAVHFLGLRDDVDSILRAADVAALSSDYEGAPLFVYECLANGTPLVSTDVGGIPDAIVDGETGILVPKGDSAALAQGLIDLLSDDDRRRRMAVAAQRSSGRYTIDAMAERVASLYDTLI